MTQNAFTIYVKDIDYYIEIYLDPFNQRIRVDDYRGNIKLMLARVEEIVKQQQAEKLIIKGRSEDFITFIEAGLQPETVVDRYFLGSDAYFF